MMQRDPQKKGLEVRLTWFPPAGQSTLSQDTSILAAAMLYGDQVTVWCPEYDDAVELPDYFELDAVDQCPVTFLGLDTSFYDPETDELVPEVDSRVSEYILGFHGATPTQDQQGWGEYWNCEDLIEWLCDELGDREKAEAEMLLVNHIVQAQNGGISLIDAFADFRKPAWHDLGEQLFKGLPEAMSAEGSLAVGSITRLPSFRRIPWDEVADIRAALDGPLGKFRAAMFSLVSDPRPHVIEPAFSDFVDTVWRRDISPALLDLEELVRSKSLRSVFFEDVLGNLSTYAGPAFGVGLAQATSIPEWIGATWGAAAALGRPLSQWLRSRKDIRQKEFYYLHELNRMMAN